MFYFITPYIKRNKLNKKLPSLNYVMSLEPGVQNRDITNNRSFRATRESSSKPVKFISTSKQGRFISEMKWALFKSIFLDANDSDVKLRVSVISSVSLL